MYYMYIYMYWRNSSIPICVIKTLIVEYMVTIFPLHCNSACGPVTCALQFYLLLSSPSPPSYQYLLYMIILALPPFLPSLCHWQIRYFTCTVHVVAFPAACFCACFCQRWQSRHFLFNVIIISLTQSCHHQINVDDHAISYCEYYSLMIPNLSIMGFSWSYNV